MRTRGNGVSVEGPAELTTMTERKVLEGLNLHLVLLPALPPSPHCCCDWAAQGTQSLPVSLLGPLPDESPAAVSVS